MRTSNYNSRLLSDRACAEVDSAMPDLFSEQIINGGHILLIRMSPGFDRND